MISNKDRSGYFGASDVAYIVGNRNTATFARWWMQKMGINRDQFDNKFTSAGTHFEHRILESLGIPMQYDRQFFIEDLLLRVNLDGNDKDTIYECKTYQWEKGFKLPKKYIQQVQVQMFATGFRQAQIVTYGLTDKDYDNYFNPIDPQRRGTIWIEYDEPWVNAILIPKLEYLSQCLREGRFPE